MNKKFLFIGISTLLLIGFLAWLFIESSKPLPGTKLPDLGRDHVPMDEKVEYNSNPPTSGKHFEEWTRSGVYSEEKEDKYLIHSLEHGYVIMHYKCDRVVAEGEATNSGTLDQVCEQRKDQLASIHQTKGGTRLIVVPRKNLDTNFALTAWTYLDKFDDFDQKRIGEFIDAHINMGPEKTME